jgi:hypothetical protein
MINPLLRKVQCTRPDGFRADSLPSHGKAVPIYEGGPRESHGLDIGIAELFGKPWYRYDLHIRDGIEQAVGSVEVRIPVRDDSAGAAYSRSHGNICPVAAPSSVCFPSLTVDVHHRRPR